MDLDGCGLDRKSEAGWTFFCLAGQPGATGFGIDEQKTLCRAVEQNLVWRTWSRWNLTCPSPKLRNG